jgi:hypothetical protein
VFVLNALSFLGVIVVLYLWKRPMAEHSTTANESIVSATWAGLRYVRYSPGIRAVLIRSGAFVLGGSAIWAILPIVTRTELRGTANIYGILLGCLGGGAVVAALLLSRFRLRFSPDQLIVSAGAVWGVSTILLGWFDNLTLAGINLLVAGIAWVTEMSSFNVAAQTVLPAWVRARALSLYLLIVQGGMALASMFWGVVAERYGNRVCLYAAGLVCLSAALLARRYPIRLGEEREITTSAHWPEPVFDTPPDPDRGPVMITMEYDIAPDDRAAFGAAMRDLGRIRLRDGAIQWGIFQDAANPDRHVESFWIESWADHLRQHERATLADREIQDRAMSFHRGASRPVATHWLAPE